MNGIREMAKAYFTGATEENKELALKSFKFMDKDGDGKISPDEYKEMVRGWYSDEQFFKKLDENGDGAIDFDEFLTLHYLQKVDIPKCDGADACNKLLMDSYFSCLLCLGNGEKSFDLCCKCYEGGKFVHEHSSDKFIDTRAQLKMFYKLLSTQKAQMAKGEKESMVKGIEAASAVIEIGSSMANVAGNCCIL